MAFVAALPLSHVRAAAAPAALRRTRFTAARPSSRAAAAAPLPARRMTTPRAAVAASVEELKKMTGYKAVDDYVTSGMVVGLGTGSTAYYAVERLGQKLKSGELKDVVAIPTSVRTRDQALDLGIPLVSLDTHPVLDVAIDGADEVDPGLNLVKGRGGALLREKMVEAQAKKFIVIVDDSKLVPGLGISGAMPVEVTPFCWEFNLKRLQELESVKGCRAELRMAEGKPYVTDNDNYIVDLYFDKPIADPAQAAKDFGSLVGVVEHGLFLGMSTAVIIAGKDGIEVKAA
jgi:ribose 5-phosphate isomerase A